MHPLTRFRNAHRPRLTQADLARMLGVSRSYIHRVEEGQRKVGAELLCTVVERTGLSPAVLRPDLHMLWRNVRNQT